MKRVEWCMRDLVVYREWTCACELSIESTQLNSIHN